jgi:hypothetical protein
MMLREILYWVSIVMMWTAMGLNVAVTVRSVRLSRKLDESRKAYDEWIDVCRSEVARLRKAEISDE